MHITTPGESRRQAIQLADRGSLSVVAVAITAVFLRQQLKGPGGGVLFLKQRLVTTKI